MNATAARILTDEIRDAIRECFPRYPTRQAAVLPALHVVNERLGYVPPEAVVEIAELLELAPAEVQDTLSFYGFFAGPAAGTRAGVGVPVAQLCRLRGRRTAGIPLREAGDSPRRDHARRAGDAAIRRVPRRLRLAPRRCWQATCCTRT